jgi:hypothetical protein
MQRLHIVTVDDIDDDLTPDDIERLEAGMARLRRLVDDPLALMERAQALIEGTAERLF